MKREIGEGFFYATFILFLVSKVLIAETVWADGVLPYMSVLNRALYVLVFLLLGILLVDMLRKETWRYRIIILGVLICLSISFLITMRPMLLSFVLLAFVAKDKDAEKIVRTYFVTIVGCLIVSTLCLFFGIARDLETVWYYGIGHSLGKAGANQLGLYMMSIVFAWGYLYRNRKWVTHVAVSWIAAILVWRITWCRTCIVLLLAYPFVLAVIRVLGRKKQIFQRLIRFVPPAVFLGNILFVPVAFLCSDILDQNFKYRFMSVIPIYEEYGIHLFGNQFICFTSEMNKNLDVEQIIMDNAYLYLLLGYGIVASIIFIIIYSMIVNRCFYMENYVLLTIAFLFLLYGVMEQGILMPQYNFVWLGLLANMRSDTERKVLTEEG